MKGLSFNIFYYKNYLLCKIFPNYVADIIKDIYLIPRNLPQQPYEAEFEKKQNITFLKSQQQVIRKEPQNLKKITKKEKI